MTWNILRFFRKSPPVEPWAPCQAELQELKKQIRRQNLLLEAFTGEVAKAVLEQRRPELEIYCALADAFFYHVQALRPQMQTMPEHLETLAIVWERLDQTLALVDLQMIRESGGIFDPKIHDAIANQAFGAADLIVVQVVQPGYLSKQRLLRPAKVVVDTQMQSEEG